MQKKAKNKWIRLGILTGWLCLMNGCHWLHPDKPADGLFPDLANGAPIQPLAIDPYTDPLQAIEIDEEHSLLVSPTDIFFQEGESFYPILVHGSPQVVGLSPDRTKFAFIEPAAFEQRGDLYVFKIANKSLLRLTNNETGGQLSVKTARWSGDQTLYYIEGYAFGTVSSGGSLYRIQANGTGGEQIFAQSQPEDVPYVEVVDFEFTPDHYLRVELEVFEELEEHPRREVRYLDLDKLQSPPERYSARRR